MSFFEDVLNGAKLAVVQVQKNFGSGFFHVTSLSTFLFVNILLPSASLEFKLYSLVTSYIVAEISVRLANSLK